MAFTRDEFEAHEEAFNTARDKSAFYGLAGVKFSKVQRYLNLVDTD